MITAEKLYFSYTASPPYILSGLNLTVEDGDYVSIVGDNGSGKSTLLRLILGLLKPTAGSVAVLARRIGYVPQRKDALHAGFPITVFEALDSYRRLLKIKNRGVVRESLEQAGISAFSGSLMDSLSGGQSQKVLIARALMGQPELLILDEPSTGVDPASQLEIYALIKKLNKERGMTIVSVEHNLTAAISNSTLIYHLVRGHGHMCSPAKFAVEYTGFGQLRGEE